ncbi:hypothetical protein LIER_24799 [Lithospermum erythrorhizon]|uniref:Reverse transcriptase zinc-binding domain-containing protein n=1 Tax=Lithospermum erythrorhizon TaxID=34254 RepID=A0AAV3R662_LITER
MAQHLWDIYNKKESLWRKWIVEYKLKGVLDEKLSDDAKRKLRISEEASVAKGHMTHIPSHCFITWILCLERLPTKDRLVSWGMNIDTKCLLCDVEESMNHMFFGCKFFWGNLEENVVLRGL